MLTNGTEVMIWNDENQLVTNFVAGAWKSEFIYDGRMRRRIERDYTWNGSAWTQTNEAHFIYDGNVIIQHRDANNLPTLTLTRGTDLSGSLQGAGGIGGLLAMTENYAINSEHSYYHADGNGNITCLISLNQIIVAKAEYDPYGNFLSLSGPKAGVNCYWFSGKPIHLASGKYDFLYRWYVPQLDRWPNQDPIGELGGLNLYGYVGNDPIQVTDPFGLAWYDDVADYWSHQGEEAKKAINNFLPPVLAAAADTIIDIGTGTFGGTPAALGHYGEGTGAWSGGGYHWGDLGGVGGDISITASAAAGILGRVPAANRPLITPRASAPPAATQPTQTPCPPKSPPKPSPKFQPPTNPPQLPPANLPPGWKVTKFGYSRNIVATTEGAIS